MSEKLFWSLLGCLSIVAAAGCGGTSQRDMMRYAISRESDDQEAESKVTETGVHLPAGVLETSEAFGTSSSSRDESAASVNMDAPTQVVATNSSDRVAVPESAQTSNSEPAPAEPPASVEERRQRTIDNLTKIGEALEKFHVAKGCYPPASISIQREPLLSWRVELLPYLGYQELYQQFNRHEAWDSKHNLALVARIPPVYQSPERMDEKTNYLAAAGTNLAFHFNHGRVSSEFTDGLANTIMVLEVDDEFAVTWTEPKDYGVPLSQLPRGLGHLREDGFFVLWGEGVVSRIAPDAPKHALQQMFTIDTGDSFRYTSIHNDPTAAPALGTAEANPRLPDASEESIAAEPATNSDEIETRGGGQPDVSEIVGTLEPPSESEKQTARELFRELYEQRYKNAKTKEARRQLAREMLEHVSKLSADPSRQFVLLELTLKAASLCGDLTTALEAAAILAQQYAVRGLEYRCDAIRIANQSGIADPNLMMDASSAAAEDAIMVDDYELAREMFGIAQSEDRRLHKHEPQWRNAKLIALKRRLDAGDRGFRSVARALLALEEDPDDPAANRAIGEYYCLIKDQWSRGLPLLAKGNHPELANLARRELQSPRSADEYVSLADGWWRYGEEHNKHQHAAQLRAVYWYRAALQQGHSGLPALKAEVRLREAESRYGHEALEALSD